MVIWIVDVLSTVGKASNTGHTQMPRTQQKDILLCAAPIQVKFRAPVQTALQTRFPIRHATDDTTTGLGGLWGLIVKERLLK